MTVVQPPGQFHSSQGAGESDYDLGLLSGPGVGPDAASLSEVGHPRACPDGSSRRDRSSTTKRTTERSTFDERSQCPTRSVKVTPQDRPARRAGPRLSRAARPPRHAHPQPDPDRRENGVRPAGQPYPDATPSLRAVTAGSPRPKPDGGLIRVPWPPPPTDPEVASTADPGTSEPRGQGGIRLLKIT